MVPKKIAGTCINICANLHACIAHISKHQAKSMYQCIDVSMYQCINVCMYVYMYVCMHVCMYARMHVCMYACRYVGMYLGM